MGRLFGTDGIRGVANVDLTPDVAHALGRATAYMLAADGGRVAVGQDTRRSGDMLVAAVSAGLTALGADVVELGVVTTPCLAFTCAGDAFAAAVMVSASHNPAPDNGLKVLRDGRKLDDEAEDGLERLMADANRLPLRRNPQIGRVQRRPDLVEPYVAHLTDAAGASLRGMRLVIDCANGSASAVAPRLFAELGADVTVLFAEPDGENINRGCGSTHPEALQRAVLEHGAEAGLAFDGDADRLIAVDERGALVDGDAVMGLLAVDRLRSGTLRNGVLVATVMSNGGLERAVTAAGGRLVRTPVGDRYVYEAMETHDAVLGGEQSGHIIFRERATTGDGLLTAIELLKAVRSGGAPLSELSSRIRRLPQVVINSRVTRKDAWERDPAFAAAVSAAEARLADRGRILVRPSGTEPKLRIMVEGEDAEEIGVIARELADLARVRLN